MDRRFVISLYLQDHTIKVVEPPVRNSGFTGKLRVCLSMMALAAAYMLNLCVSSTIHSVLLSFKIKDDHTN